MIGLVANPTIKPRRRAGVYCYSLEHQLPRERAHDNDAEDEADTMIRPATIHDVPRIQEIINSHAELGKMLFKSFAQLYESLRDFAVAERDGRVVGCTALTIIWADLAEIRSL